MGLDQRKLADTIAQLGSDASPDAALVCDVPENPDAWVHLARVCPAEGTSPSNCWNLTAGYPSSLPPLEILPKIISIQDGAFIDSWTQGVYVRLSLPASVDPVVISRLIEQLMTSVQGVSSRMQVDVALETD